MKSLADGEGFEPPGLSPNGFQDRRLRPLGHPSMLKNRQRKCSFYGLILLSSSPDCLVELAGILHTYEDFLDFGVRIFCSDQI